MKPSKRLPLHTKDTLEMRDLPNQIQKLETAAHPDMPESAIASGCIDFILSPEDIAQEIVKIAHDAKRQNTGSSEMRGTGQG